MKNTHTQILSYTFTDSRDSFMVDAANYGEALAALIFHCGSEAEAAEFTFTFAV